jgi:phage terminase large subunit
VEKIEVELFGEQFKAFNFTTQFAAAIAGVQGGKTFVGSLWAGKKINDFPKGVGIIAAPTYKILNQSTLVKFFTHFPSLKQYHKEQKGEIQLPTGGTVFLRSLDQPWGAEGITADWIWGDEAGQMSRNAWTVFRARVSTTRGQVFLTTTWYDLGWLYQEFYVPWEKGTDAAYSVFRWRSVDNPAFPQDYYEAEKKRLSPEEFARRYDAIPTKMEGLVYDLPADQIIAPIPLASLNIKDIIYGLDFGFHNPAAGVALVITSDNIVYVVDDSIYTSGLTQDDLEDRLRTLRQQIPFTYTYPDPAEPDRILSMKRKGFYVRAVDKNVELGINAVRELIRKKQLFVFNTCRNFLDEINSYHYDSNKLKEEPVKDKDHLMDALRYAIYNHHPKPAPIFDLKVTGGVKPFLQGIG